MKRLNNLSENTFLKLFFLCFSCAFLIAAVCMPDRGNMLSGYWQILSQPTKAYTNFFAVGGYAATFLNMGLVGLFCTGIYCIPGRKENHAATLVTILTTGFGSWGIHLLNIWPTILGVFLYCAVKKEKPGNHTNAMLFTTGVAPFISELMVRYPNDGVVGFRLTGILLAVGIGALVGLFLPAGLDNSPRVHKGGDIYSAALPVGMTALVMQGLLYRAMGVEVPDAVAELHVASAQIVNIFCISLFCLCIVFALLMGCTPRKYWKLLTAPDPVQCFSSTYGNCVFLMNVGVFGLFILSYYNLIGAEFNGVTFGVMFCMLATCNAGSHPLNVLPIMCGYAIAAFSSQLLSGVAGGTFVQALNVQNIIVGLCYANGLSPISDKYGWKYGLLASVMHYLMVTTIPLLHGDLCLYNGGFTAALVCLLLVPELEHLSQPKLSRRAQRRAKRLAAKQTK